jgi:hypothetical protein
MMPPMLGRTYDNQICSVAGSLGLVGERWTLLIVRDAFLGARRFEDFQRSLGVATCTRSDPSATSTASPTRASTSGR